MRKATNIEHILCDVHDLLVAVARGEFSVTSCYFNCNDDLVVCVESERGSFDFTVGVDDED